MKQLLLSLALLLCVPGAVAQSDTTFYIDGGKGRLAARLQQPATPDDVTYPLVVVCHGFTGSMNDPLLVALSQNLADAGVGVLRFDFNGHGKSDGAFEEMTVENEIADLMAVVAYARTLPMVSSISLAGHSQGGVVVAMAAGRLGDEVIQSVELLAPAGILREDVLRGNVMGARFDPLHLTGDVPLPGGKMLGRAYIEVARGLDIYGTAQRYEGPAVVVHGMADVVVPYSCGEQFALVMPQCELVLLPGEDHVFSQQLERAARLAADKLLALIAR